MVKVTLPEQQQGKKPSYPYFGKSKVTGAIYYVASSYAICIEPGESDKDQSEQVTDLLEKNIIPISGPITFENVFE